MERKPVGLEVGGSFGVAAATATGGVDATGGKFIVVCDGREGRFGLLAGGAGKGASCNAGYNKQGNQRHSPRHSWTGTDRAGRYSRVFLQTNRRPQQPRRRLHQS